MPPWRVPLPIVKKLDSEEKWGYKIFFRERSEWILPPIRSAASCDSTPHIYGTMTVMLYLSLQL